MKRESKARKGCLWSLVVMPVLLLGYFLLLPTNVFDSKPRNYPDLENWAPPPGPTLSLGEALESSASFADWLAWQETEGGELLREAIESKSPDVPPPEWREETFDQLRRAALIARDVAALEATIYSEVESVPDGEATTKQSIELQWVRDIFRHLRRLHSFAKLGIIESEGDINSSEAALCLLGKLQPSTNQMIPRLTWLSCEVRAMQTVMADLHGAAISCDEDSLRKLAARVGSYREPRDQSLARVFAGEFRGMKPVFPQLKKELLAGQAKLFDEDPSSDRHPELWLGFRLQPNRTIDDLAKKHREHIRLANFPARERVLPTREHSLWFLSYSPAPNAGGEILLAFDDSPVEKFYHLEDRALAVHRLTITLVALARYRIANDGKLPPTLDTLVPRFLESVPVDPFTGDPPGYHPAAGRLFSVGGDFVDSGTALDWEEEEEALDLGAAPGTSALWQKTGTGDDILIDLKTFFGVEPIRH